MTISKSPRLKRFMRRGDGFNGHYLLDVDMRHFDDKD